MSEKDSDVTSKVVGGEEVKDLDEEIDRALLPLKETLEPPPESDTKDGNDEEESRTTTVMDESACEKPSEKDSATVEEPNPAEAIEDFSEEDPDRDNDEDDEVDDESHYDEGYDDGPDDYPEESDEEAPDDKTADSTAEEKEPEDEDGGPSMETAHEMAIRAMAILALMSGSSKSKNPPCNNLLRIEEALRNQTRGISNRFFIFTILTILALMFFEIVITRVQATHYEQKIATLKSETEQVKQELKSSRKNESAAKSDADKKAGIITALKEENATLKNENRELTKFGTVQSQEAEKLKDELSRAKRELEKAEREKAQLQEKKKGEKRSLVEGPKEMEDSPEELPKPTAEVVD